MLSRLLPGVSYWASATKQRGQGHHMTCPECRETTFLPPKGVAGLRSACLTNNLQDFLDNFKKVDGVKNTASCPEHGKKRELFCYDCVECLCCECAGEHHEHVCADIDEAFERYQTKVLPQLVEEYTQAKELDIHELPHVYRAKILTRFSHHLESFKKYLITEDKIEALKKLWITEKKCREELDTKCYATGRGLVKARMREKATFHLYTISKGPMTVECILMSENSDDDDSGVLGNVEVLGEYTYEISYQPVTEGRHQLHVKVSGQHIKGSPFTVNVAKFLMHPYGLAISKNGNRVISEVGGDCVTVIHPNFFSIEIRSFGTRGSGLGQLNSPLGVAVDGEENILVADCNNHRIQKFTPRGQFLQAVGSKGSGRLQFVYPKDIAVNPVTKMVYVVDANHHVQILNSDLTFFKKVGTHGHNIRQFNDPQAIACDSTGKVYVADTGNKRIQVFTAEGGFLRMFDTPNFPISIAVDSSDSVYVGEYECHHISVFTPEGKLITSSFTKMTNPSAITVDGGIVYVVDSTGLSKSFLFSVIYNVLGFIVILGCVLVCIIFLFRPL